MNNLRMICDHFQLGGGAISVKKKHHHQQQQQQQQQQQRYETVKKVLTLDELTQVLRENEQHAYCGATKKWLSAKCKLAGVLMLECEYEQAAYMYASVLQHAHEDKDGKCVCTCVCVCVCVCVI
jgi:ABC-type transport system involved in cytochrome bd biosynthesis fused ATPase/permease subunit